MWSASLRETQQPPLQDLAWGREVAGSSWFWRPAAHTSTNSSTMGAARSCCAAGGVPVRWRRWHSTECQLPPRPRTSWFQGKDGLLFSVGMAKLSARGNPHPKLYDHLPSVLITSCWSTWMHTLIQRKKRQC